VRPQARGHATAQQVQRRKEILVAQHGSRLARRKVPQYFLHAANESVQTREVGFKFKLKLCAVTDGILNPAIDQGIFIRLNENEKPK